MIRGNSGIGGCKGLNAGPKGDGVKLKPVHLAPIGAGQKTRGLAVGCRLLRH